ncbi:MAG: porin [Candidatus Competibacteraceae bacterium]
MKKSAIAIAVAAALGTSAVAMAETTLYGSARVSVDWTNPDMSTFEDLNYRATPDDNFQTVNTNKYLQVWNDSSRLGVRGSEDLGSGISAIYQYEFGVDVPGGNNYFNSNRPRWVGLKGDFGALTLGTQFTPFYNVIGYTDTFNSNKTFDQDYYLRGTQTLSNPVLFQKGIAELRRGSSVVYTTPNWNGLSAQGMVVMNGTPGANNVDQWEANLTYSNGPWFVGGAVLQDRDVTYTSSTPGARTVAQTQDNHDMQYGVALGFDNKRFGIGASWQQYHPENDLTGPDAFVITLPTATAAGGLTGVEHTTVNAYTLQGQYYFGSEVLRLTGSYIKPKDLDSKQWVVEFGFQHNLSKRTRLWAEYIYTTQKFEDNTVTVATPTGTAVFDINPNDANMHMVSAGIRHDF